MRRTRVVRLTRPMIEQMLGVPNGGRVVSVGTSHDPWVIDIVVEHPDYDEVPDEACSPVVMGEIVVHEVQYETLDSAEPKVYRYWELKR